MILGMGPRAARQCSLIYVQAHLYKGKGNSKMSDMRSSPVVRARSKRNLLVSVLAPLVVGIVELLYKVRMRRVSTAGEYRTFGSVTLGMTTTFNADGASFLTLVSPPGWYWYGPDPPASFHGSLPSALATARSDEALVGERAERHQYVHHKSYTFLFQAYRNAILQDRTLRS